MKITQSQLRRIIKEELKATLNEEYEKVPSNILDALDNIRETNPEAAQKLALNSGASKLGMAAGPISRGEIDPPAAWTQVQRVMQSVAPEIAEALGVWLEKFMSRDSRASSAVSGAQVHEAAFRAIYHALVGS